MKTILVMTALAFAAAVAAAGVVKIQLPLETAVYKAAPGVQLANGQCLTCHSADYAAMQPAKARDFWKAEVDKILEGLTAYFARNYGTETLARENTNAVSPPVASTPAAIDAKALALKSGCLNCHRVDTKLIGPSYKEVASKYRGKPDGQDRIAHQITRGGGGQWGQIPMPPFTQFSPAEVEALSRWILSQ
jgi:cytochrome c